MVNELQIQANDGEHFIVRVNEDYFFLTFGEDGEDIRGTKILSEAAHLSYRDADVLTQSLRTRNYDAVVNDRYGIAVTEQSLRKIDAPTLPMSLEEYHDIPASTMKRRYFSEDLFRRRVDEARKQGIIDICF